MFSKNIRTIYLYLVCFVTLFMLLAGVISVISNISEIVFPTESFAYSIVEKENSMNRQIKDIIYSTTIIAVGLPVYLFTWNKIEKERKCIANLESEVK